MEGGFEDYLNNFSTDSVSTGELEALALSHYISCQREVYMEGPLRRAQRHGDTRGHTPIRLLFHPAGNYEALIVPPTIDTPTTVNDSPIHTDTADSAATIAESPSGSPR